MGVTHHPQIAALVLAGGLSRRAGSLNKLLLPLANAALIVHAVEAALGSLATPVIVVTGYDATRLREALGTRNLIYTHNADYLEGQASSIRCGLNALPQGIDGALICLGDMPQIKSQHLNALVDSFMPDSISVPRCAGRRGNPVLFPASVFPQLNKLTGDIGGRELIATGSTPVIEVEVDSPAIFYDVDCKDDLDVLNGQ
jgi:molybdenum cofactor cytidylyltransferase